MLRRGDLNRKMSQEEKKINSVAGEGCPVLVPDEDKKSLKEIEKSIIKKFRKQLWSPFIKGIKKYNLVEEGDKIAIAISGGKDSLVLAKLFQELQRHGQVNFELEFIAMDPGYHPNIKELLIENCEHLNIPVHIYESRIFDIVDNIAQEYPCYMCAKMRRGSLYDKAKQLGCNKLALGHHFNDVIETSLMNILYAGTVKTMLPKLKSQNFENMELIRPMYMIRERDIEAWTRYIGIWPLNCACMVAAKRTSNMRYELKEMIENLSVDTKVVEKSIFSALHNLNLDASIGWVKDGEKHSYLDEYDDEE
jgi:tRNA(Ile)-lysidine synthase TilS/MesJ